MTKRHPSSKLTPYHLQINQEDIILETYYFDTSSIKDASKNWSHIMLAVQRGELLGVISEAVLFEVTKHHYDKQKTDSTSPVSSYNQAQLKEHFCALLTGFKILYLNHGFKIIPYLPVEDDKYNLQDILNDPSTFFSSDPSVKKNDRKDAAIFCGALNNLNPETSIIVTNESSERLRGAFEGKGYSVLNAQKFADKIGVNAKKGIKLQGTPVTELLKQGNLYQIEPLVYKELTLAAPEYAQLFITSDSKYDKPEAVSFEEFIDSDKDIKETILAWCFFLNDSINKNKFIEIVANKLKVPPEKIVLHINQLIDATLILEIGEFYLPNFKETDLALKFMDDIGEYINE